MTVRIKTSCVVAEENNNTNN